MAESFDRGRDWERKVFKLMRSILKVDVKRDSRSGAGAVHKADGRDQFAKVPLFVECKDQERLNVKKDWRMADAKASYGQASVVVFPDNEETLCVMRFSDLLHFIRSEWDWKEAADDLRKPNSVTVDTIKDNGHTLSAVDLQDIVAKKKSISDVKECANGHIVDDYGYCMQKGCKFSRGYRAPKGKK